jgi:pentatricopeptide repeat protein
MADRQVEANTITYSSAISACENAGKWVRALQLLDGMANSRVETDSITHNAAISACEGDTLILGYAS